MLGGCVCMLGGCVLMPGGCVCVCVRVWYPWCRYLPNPKHTSPRAMEMLVFLGRLMGMSLRHKSTLPFLFPSIVWKPLVGVPLTSQDMMQVGAQLLRDVPVSTWSMEGGLVCV